MNKKLLLASSIAVALGASAAANANHVDLDGPPEEVAVFASERNVDPVDGLFLGDGTGGAAASSAQLDPQAAIGVGIGAETTRFFRWDLDDGISDPAGNPLFANLPTQTIFDCAGGDPSSSIVQGGVGEDFVIFEVSTAAGVTCGQTNRVEIITGAGENSIEVFNQEGVNAQFRHYETLTQATNETDDLFGIAKDIVEWSPALKAAFAATGTAGNIDVTTENTLFDGGNPPDTDATLIGNFDIGVNAAPDGKFGIFDADGSEIILSDIISDSDVLVRGPNLVNPPGVTLGYSGVAAAACDGTDEVDLALAANFDNGNVVINFGNAPDNSDFCLTVTGTDALVEGTFEAQFVPVANSDFTAPSFSFTAMDTLEKNGTSAEANFLLTPEGVFRNFVRITNPSPVDGRVFIRLINDAGDEVSVDLDEITVDNGGTPETLPAQLAAGASTPLININEVYAAAQAKDPTFEVVGGPKADKLRTIVDAEFGAPGALSGSGSIDGSSFDFSGTEGRDTGVRIDVISVSNDNQSFFKFGN